MAEEVDKEKGLWAQIQVNQFNSGIWRCQQHSGWKTGDLCLQRQLLVRIMKRSRLKSSKTLCLWHDSKILQQPVCARGFTHPAQNNSSNSDGRFPKTKSRLYIKFHFWSCSLQWMFTQWPELVKIHNVIVMNNNKPSVNIILPCKYMACKVNSTTESLV